jgi:flagellar protein FlaJ
MGLIERVARVVKRIFPSKFLSKLERRLESTKIALAAEEYVGVSVLITIGICIGIGLLNLIVALPLLPLLLIASAPITFILLTLGVPYYLAQRRAAELERVLPDALRQMASTLRAGVGIDGAMEDIAKSKYGALSQEFERAVVEIRRGRSLDSALLALARRSNSPLYERGFHLIVEGVERGAAIADVLDAVASDIREVHAIQRERRATTMQQVLFLTMAALFAAPFIIGLTIAIGGRFGGVGVRGGALPSEIGAIAAAYVAIQGLICAIAVGIIRYGQMRKGFMFIAPFVAATLGVFYAARFVIEIMLPA